MKCKHCGFDAPVWEWEMVESSGTTKVPEADLQEYNKFIDGQEGGNPLMKWFVKFVVGALGRTGSMPYHQTQYVCPKCGR